MSEQAAPASASPEALEDAREEVAEIEAVQEEAVTEAVEEAVAEVIEEVQEAADDAAEEIEEATGEHIEPDERQVLAGIIAAQVVETLTPYLNPIAPPEPEEVAEVVVEDEPVAPDVAPVSSHWTERRLWGR